MKKFIRTPRPIIYLWIMGFINSTSYCIYNYLVMFAGFDSRNPYYGLVELKAKDIAILLNKSVKTIQNTIEALAEINAISITEDGYIVIKNYEKLYVKPNETFPGDKDQLPILEELFSINMKSFSSNRKENLTNQKKVSNQDQDTLNKINKSDSYNIRYHQRCKIEDTKQVDTNNRAMDQNVSDEEFDRILC